jgi:imidazolonepropionase-like amidohydrolase
MDDGNFGVARDLADGWETPYEKMVLIYGFHELYAAVVQLRAAEEAVRDIAAAITAFRTAIERGDTEMAQLSLKRASDAFVTVTRELVNGAQSRLEALEGLLAYHDLSATFDRQVAKRSDLAGADLDHYRSATEALVEAARRQHARSEQAREAYHLYTDSG